MVDSPTNNFATLNPLDNYYAGNTFSEGNLEIAQGTSGPYTYNSSTISISSGKWYSEFLMVDDDRGSGYILTGISSVYPDATTDELGDNANAWAYYGNTGNYWNNNSGTSYGNTYTEGDLIGVALDLENNNLYFSKNGVWQNSGDPESGATGTGAISITAGEYRFCIGSFDGAYSFIFGANFGADSSFAAQKTAQGNQDSNGIGDFYYEPPADYLALCTSNLASPEIALPTDHFEPVIYTGTGANQAISSLEFSPDLIWIKRRDGAAQSHQLVDSVRGATNAVASDLNNAEYTSGLASINSNGWTTLNSSEGAVNASGNTYVAWNWLAGGAAASNTDGTITSSVSANPTAGFSIVSYTGNSTSGATFGHGLSQAPELVIIKNRDSTSGTSSTAGWVVYSEPVGNTKYLYLNETDAEATDSGRFNDTTPSASVVTLGDDGVVNGSDDFIAYCFHSVDGYSKVGSYTGNDSTDGTFGYCGFRPALIMVKRIDTSGTGWVLMDAVRNTYNVMNDSLLANSSAAENDARATMPLDFVSNGFKWRINYSDVNGASGGTNHTYIYYAVAESPFKTSNAR
jgi:hypothetical protein